MCFWVRYKVELTIVLSIIAACAIFCATGFCESTDSGINAPKAAEAAADQVIVRIGKRTITRKALDIRTKRRAQKHRQKVDDRQIATLVDQLADQTLFAEEARAMGLDKDETVQIMIQDMVDKLLANLYVRRYVLPASQVSEADISAYYKSHAGLWRRPEAVRARHILLRVDSRATAQAVTAVEKRALEIRHRLEAGEDFARLAENFSEDTGTKKSGGDLGFFTRKGKVAAISDAAFAMKPGQISNPVRSSVGYHILQVMERRPAGVKPLKEVSGEIRSLLLREKRVDAAKAARKRLEEKFNLHVHESFRLEGGKVEH
jgi:parvulin-like peptidyl-prolyl isomerase